MGGNEMKKIGFVGCGNISGIYFQNIKNTFKEIEIAGVCDLVPGRAQNAIDSHGIKCKVYKDMHELFADPEVDIVLNITRPYEHYGVSKAALLAGKHVYCEKPLGATFEEGVELVALAKEKGLRLGGAPDTFLGAGIQTCRRLIDEGKIGQIFGSSAFMVCHGHETWHPDPAFYYQFGGGPMLDMGPYYISALVNLMGPVKSTAGMAKISLPQRLITSQPFNGTKVDVEVSTYVTGMMNFHSGAVGTIFTTFDVYRANLPIIEIYGSEGTLSVPDPNGFGGPVRLFRHDTGEFKEIEVDEGYSSNSRALGLADMAKALETGRKARASSDLTFHVLDIMTSFQRSSDSKQHIELTTKPERPAPMVKPATLGILD